jgi:hypothetical protein
MISKIIHFSFLIGFIFSAPAAMAHAILASQSQTDGDYILEFEATADASAIFAKEPVTYIFRLRDKKTEKILETFDSVFVDILKKDGSLVVEARLDSSSGFASGPTLSAGIAEAGEYVMDVSFEKEDAKDVRKEIAKATFSFQVAEPQSQQATPVEEASSANTAVFVWGTILFVFGAVLGRVSSLFIKR